MFFNTVSTPLSFSFTFPAFSAKKNPSGCVWWFWLCVGVGGFGVFVVWVLGLFVFYDTALPFDLLTPPCDACF